MTKGELVKMLSIYDDDVEVKITLSCDNAYRTLDEVKKVNDKLVGIESWEVPDVDDLYLLAAATLDNYGEDMMNGDYNRFTEFLR